MIESEEQRKKITQALRQWCNHIKATPLLREGDIPSLVRTITGEFYHITLCCGHMVKDLDETVTIEFYEYDDKTKGTIVGSYCRDCAEEYKKKLGAWELNEKIE